MHRIPKARPRSKVAVSCIRADESSTAQRHTAIALPISKTEGSRTMKNGKLSRRDTLKIGGAATGATLLSRSHIARAADKTIKFWNGTYAFQDPTDKNKPKSDFYIYQAIDRYQTANPG